MSLTAATKLMLNNKLFIDVDENYNVMLHLIVVRQHCCFLQDLVFLKHCCKLYRTAINTL